MGRRMELGGRVYGRLGMSDGKGRSKERTNVRRV